MENKLKDKHFLNLLCESVDAIGARIYTFQSVCVGLFKSLNEFHQTLLVKLASFKGFSIESLLGPTPEFQKRVDEIEKLLITQYKVVVKELSDSRQPGEEKRVQYKIEKNFGESLRRFLSHGLEVIFPVKREGMQKCIENSAKLEHKLKGHAFSNWHIMLKYMLKRDGGSRSELPNNVRGALSDSNLLMSRDKNNSTCFDFLLDSLRNQVSAFLYAYCKHLFKVKYNYLRGDKSQKEAVGEGNILNLIFHLTLLFPLMRYSIKDMQEHLASLHLTLEVINDIMRDLDAVGLIKIQTTEDTKQISYFTTTPLINNVFNPNVQLEGGFKNDIIVETDFKLYAYSNNSEYLEALLELFSEIKFRMPTLLVCSLEETKIREVYKTGIKPQQILSYLNNNTHKEVRRSRIQAMTEEEVRQIDSSFAFIPENIIEQLIIWQQ